MRNIIMRSIAFQKMSSVTDDKTCPYCHRSDFVSSHGMKIHIGKAHQDDMATCRFCGKNDLEGLRGLHIHVSKIHKHEKESRGTSSVPPLSRPLLWREKDAPINGHIEEWIQRVEDKKGTERIPCEFCGEPFLPKGMGRHQSVKHPSEYGRKKEAELKTPKSKRGSQSRYCTGEAWERSSASISPSQADSGFAESFTTEGSSSKLSMVPSRSAASTFTKSGPSTHCCAKDEFQMSSATDDKTCPYCHRSDFVSSHGMKIHIGKAHQDDMATCRFCGKNDLEGLRGLHIHVSKIHKHEKESRGTSSVPPLSRPLLWREKDAPINGHIEEWIQRVEDKKGTERIPCEFCGEPFLPKGMGRHQSVKHPSEYGRKKEAELKTPKSKRGSQSRYCTGEAWERSSASISPSQADSGFAESFTTEGSSSKLSMVPSRSAASTFTKSGPSTHCCAKDEFQMSSATDDKTCPYCHRSDFVSSHGMKIHIGKVHQDDMATCRFCGKNDLEGLRGLNIHISMMHKDHGSTKPLRIYERSQFLDHCGPAEVFPNDSFIVDPCTSEASNSPSTSTPLLRCTNETRSKRPASVSASGKLSAKSSVGSSFEKCPLCKNSGAFFQTEGDLNKHIREHCKSEELQAAVDRKYRTLALAKRAVSDQAETLNRITDELERIIMRDSEYRWHRENVGSYYDKTKVSPDAYTTT